MTGAVSAPPPAPAAPAVRGSRAARVAGVVRRRPSGLLGCAAVGFVCAAAFAVITPTFQGPDEVSQLSHAQYIATHGSPPKPVQPARGQPIFLPPDISAVWQGIPWSVLGRPYWSRTLSAALDRRLDAGLADTASGGPTAVTSYPPLYFTLQAGVWHAGFWGDTLDRILLMRLFSALLAALTVAFTFLFVRELMPSAPWAWRVGALAVAFQPVFAFMGGAINNDNLVYALGTVVLWLLARAFRRGFDVRAGAWIGVVLAAALLTKGSAYGLVPGVVVGLAVLVLRAGRGSRAAPLRGSALALGLPAAAYAAWLAFQALALGTVASTATGGLTSGAVDQSTSISGQLSYLWQYFLPRLWFMAEWFPQQSHYPLWDTYITAFIGRFGWFQFGFPSWFNVTAAGVYAAILALTGAALYRFRSAIRGRAGELLTYLALFGGLVVFVAVAGYRFRAATGFYFEQVRYLFPLIGLYGALVAVAARGAGPRWGRAVGAFLVVLAAGHLIAALLLTFNRYYV